ncbi:leucine-rich repeat-containing protein 27-like isoform X2 [Pseudorasbora parva]|uniref:leucine-rich repeat-containing protein 27-like isoform X2 n=1 Tax=Pseudorasbora parva TaxID=51549 RepID=UPI00351E5433
MAGMMGDHNISEESASLLMRRRGLKAISASVLQMTHLQSLYLEGNEIGELPERFFASFPSLIWLDLRNNQLKALPVAIGEHTCLKTFLLEGNPLTTLPPELGNLVSLKALSLRNCPLTFPPRDVLDRGLPNILLYLRRSQLESEVEKLRLPNLDVCEEDNPDIRHFQDLRLRIIQMEREESDGPCRSRVQELPREQRNQARVARKNLEARPRRRDEVALLPSHMNQPL